MPFTWFGLLGGNGDNGDGDGEQADPNAAPPTHQAPPPNPQAAPLNPHAAQSNPNGGYPHGGHPHGGHLNGANPNANGERPKDKPQEPEKQERGTHPVAVTITGLMRTAFRIIQCAMGLTVVVLYAIIMITDRKRHGHVDGKVVYVLLCGSLGFVVGPCLLVPRQTWLFFVVDIIMWLCYMVAFSMFGAVYIRKQSEGNLRIAREKKAVWILLVNVGLWLLAAIWSTGVYLLSTKARTSFHSKRLESLATNNYE